MTDAVILAQAAKRKKQQSASTIVGKVFIYISLIIFAIWILIPFYIIVIASLKLPEETILTDNVFGLPSGAHFDAYLLAFTPQVGESIPMLMKGFLNTLWIVLPPTLLGLFTSSLAAYAFAKLRFRAKNFLFGFLLATMMIPGTVTLTPSYLIYAEIGWTATPLPLMIPGMFGAAACVFFMRQFYTGIPTDLIEAAKLDGMGYFGIFFKIMVPLSVPALIAQGILGFLGGYNDYFGPLLYLAGSNFETLQMTLYNFIGQYADETPRMMASSVVALAPMLVIYIVAQKFFIQGIATAGMKI